jgi:hypothetical protein
MTFTELSGILRPKLGDEWLALVCLALGVSRRTRQKWHQRSMESPDETISTASDFTERLARELATLADKLDDGAEALDPSTPD